ncbi:MAG TPA: GNAT family protein [Mycobacteriales bacterium]|nr:GNAT family protein [Mycobacteriales bacterium]
MGTRHPGWPAWLAHGPVGLRPLRYRDARAWSELRLRNEGWLAPWEPTAPVAWRHRHSVAAYPAMLARLRRMARDGWALPWGVTYDDRLVGQLSVLNIVRGAALSAQVGYWVDQAHAGRGVTTTALALAVDHCFGPVGLHRVQVDIRPENAASRRVVAKLGFREEALFRRYLDIAGAWRDHIGYALTVEDCPRGLVSTLSER